MDLNHRTRLRADLQSAAFNHSAIDPNKKNTSSSQGQESNLRPPVYKTDALPTELPWPFFFLKAEEYISWTCRHKNY